MQLAAAGAALAQRADRPRVPRGARRGRWIAIAAVAASAAAAIVIWRVALPSQPSLDARVAAVLGPTRGMLARVPYAPLDRYRPYDTQRGTAALERIPLALAAELEDQHDPGALASVYIARNDLSQASALLEGAGGDAVSLARSALEIQQQRYHEALRHTDAVLVTKPRHPTAAWNRAIALEQLDLPLAAAEMYRIVADAREPGWSDEARAKAQQLGDREAARAAAWKEKNAVCHALGTGKVGPLDVIERAASVCRPAFYEALRIARTAEQRAALAPVAVLVDKDTGANAAQALLARANAAPDRDRAVDAYLQLTQQRDLPDADKQRLVEALRAHDDLLLGAITRAGLTNLASEYITRALRSENPYFIAVAHERQAKAFLAQGDPLSAEALLLPLAQTCAQSKVELRCPYLYFALADVYLVLHRPEKSRKVLLEGLRLSRELGTYWDERQFFDYLAEVARMELDHAAMRAYLREATLRSGGECEQERFALESLAEASIDALAFDRARRDLAAAPLCKVPANPSRLRILAELASEGTNEADLATARAGFAAARQGELSPGDRAYLDALEGRLLAPTDPDAAARLLTAAVAATRHAPPADVPAAKARADAYASLIVLAARRDDAPGALALFAEATGVTDRAPCSVGAMVDGKRIVVVAQTPQQTLQHFAERGRKAAAIDAASLVPPALRAALVECPRVDVLALPPVFGLPELLPPDLAWSYRGRATRIATPVDRKPTVLVVADTKPPAELALPPLQATNLAPIADATLVELRGDAATPERTHQSLPRADAIEIHSHGYMNLGESDASLIALSPDGAGKFTLTAREIVAQPLPRAPVVVLAACHAGYSAPYRHESWGLPRAFLVAGARVVLASRDAIPDGEAGFFRDVEARILAGTDPAVALRDARMKKPAPWTRSVLVFD